MAPDQSSQAIPFQGYVDTTGDALRLIQAARCGLIPRITRRLNELERRSMIRSGAIFVFSVEESGIKRWTEGLQWSPSRIAGNFLLYKEVNERAPQRGKTNIASESNVDGGATYKPYGLCKKTITVKIEGSDHHLVSYFTMNDIETGRLRRPTCRPDIMAIDIPAELVQSTNFRYPPQIETGPDGRLTRIHDIEEMSEPFEKESPIEYGNPSFSTASPHAEYAPTTSQFMQNAGEPRSFHGPAIVRSTSQSSRVDIATPLPSQAYRLYEHGAHQPAFRPDDSPHSQHHSQYSPFGSLPQHDVNSIYPPYNTSNHSFPQAASSPPQATWEHGKNAMVRVEHAPGAMSGQYALTRLAPDTDTWASSGQPHSGQSLASAPPLSTSMLSSLPSGRGEHMRTRSTPSTWSMGQGHGVPLHAPMARYPEEAHRGQPSPPPSHGGAGHCDNM